MSAVLVAGGKGALASRVSPGRRTCPEYAKGIQGWAEFVASDPENRCRLRLRTTG